MTTTALDSLTSAAEADARQSMRTLSRTIAMLIGIAAMNVAALAMILTFSRASAGLLVLSAGGCISFACYLSLEYRKQYSTVHNRGRASRMESDLFDVDTRTFGPRYVELGYSQEMSLTERSQSRMTLMSAAFNYEHVAREHGTSAAEHLLQVLAQILKSALRGSDVICHYELGEFVVLMPDTDLRQADIPRQRVLQAVEQWNLETRLKYRLALRVGLGDCGDGLDTAVRDARLVCSMSPLPSPFSSNGYTPRPVAVN